MMTIAIPPTCSSMASTDNPAGLGGLRAIWDWCCVSSSPPYRLKSLTPSADRGGQRDNNLCRLLAEDLWRTERLRPGNRLDRDALAVFSGRAAAASNVTTSSKSSAVEAVLEL